MRTALWLAILLAGSTLSHAAEQKAPPAETALNNCAEICRKSDLLKKFTAEEKAAFQECMAIDFCLGPKGPYSEPIANQPPQIKNEVRG